MDVRGVPGSLNHQTPPLLSLPADRADLGRLVLLWYGKVAGCLGLSSRVKMRGGRLANGPKPLTGVNAVFYLSFGYWTYRMTVMLT
jgi:hypothetical protein